MIGTAISLFAILLCSRHPEVSPWFAFVLVIYPFVDTTWAIVRRVINRRPIMEPDADHMHTLLAARLTGSYGTKGRNVASLLVVTAAGLFILAGAVWHTNTGGLVGLCALFVALYVTVYLRIMPAKRATVEMPDSGASAKSA